MLLNRLLGALSIDFFFFFVFFDLFGIDLLRYFLQDRGRAEFIDFPIDLLF